MAESKQPGSFRDPSGFVFWREGTLYRQINVGYKEQFERLARSGLYDKLVESKLLVPHEDVSLAESFTEEAYRVIRPTPIPFISYPYEWCFSQLRDAALLTLEIQKRALQYGMVLKDSSAYNIQFHRGRPILIDTLSFEIYREGDPWVAYRQFCRHFLAPLALMSYRDTRLGSMARLHIDGIPLDLASSLLPASSMFRISLLSHLHLHAKAERALSGDSTPSRKARVSARGLSALIENLESAIGSLRSKDAASDWSDYYGDHNYSATAFAQKEDLVAKFLDRSQPRTVWDLGANRGVFSRISSKRGTLTVSLDRDHAVVEANYLQAKEAQDRNLLPLVLDLANPSPGVGWANAERDSLVARGPADTVLALALLHHLAISNNVPLPDIARFLRRLSGWIIVEFVPKEDSQVQRLLATREDVFPTYTRAGFEHAFAPQFEVIEAVQLEGSERVLYCMRARQS